VIAMPKDPRARPLLIGAIADDAAGATDLGSTLSRNGMDVVQLLGPPAEGEPPIDADAIVIALEIRTAPVERAVAEAQGAARWLRTRGAQQLFFRYSSTFDSTESGNIGPVAEALLDLVEDDFTVACPSEPDSGRTVFQGHLFVGDRLVSESSMRHHPLTPMADADLVRLLGRQCRQPETVGLIPFGVVDQGANAIRKSIADLRARGTRLAVVDAAKEDHLWSVATAVAELRVVTGGSGVARGIPANHRRNDALPQRIEPQLPGLAAPLAILAGSCSEATRTQVATMAARHPSLALDPLALATEDHTVGEVVAAAQSALTGGTVLIHSTVAPDELERARKTLGEEQASRILEEAFGRVASGLVEGGLRSLLVAGSETARIVADALGLQRLRLGPDIEAGVPWTRHLGEPDVYVAFKPGPFGSDRFFLEALSRLGQA
jgi:uncharacterized protein YgbK (DUF1537 family)